MSDPESQTLRQEINSLSNKIDLKDRDATALMQIVIQTNKDVSNNLVKLTEVVSNVTVLERTQEAQQAALNKISERVADNETDIKLSLQDKRHIKESLEEIKENQNTARALVAKIFGTIITLAIVGGLTASLMGQFK
jgi:chromosome segregation ATPase